jgi:hypothetical protein
VLTQNVPEPLRCFQSRYWYRYSSFRYGTSLSFLILRSTTESFKALRNETKKRGRKVGNPWGNEPDQKGKVLLEGRFTVKPTSSIGIGVVFTIIPINDCSSLSQKQMLYRLYYYLNITVNQVSQRDE